MVPRLGRQCWLEQPAFVHGPTRSSITNLTPRTIRSAQPRTEKSSKEAGIEKLVVSLFIAGVVSISANIERSFADTSRTRLRRNKSRKAMPCRLPRPCIRGIRVCAGCTRRSACWRRTISLVIPDRRFRCRGARCRLRRSKIGLSAWCAGSLPACLKAGLRWRLLPSFARTASSLSPISVTSSTSNPIAQSIEQDLAAVPDRAAKEKALSEELHAKLGVVPEVTHLDGQVVSADQLAHAVTDGYEWTEFDLSPDGSEAWGPSRDPDARPETRVKFVKLEVLIDLIHRSLARGRRWYGGRPTMPC